MQPAYTESLIVPRGIGYTSVYSGEEEGWQVGDLECDINMVKPEFSHGDNWES